MPFYLFSPITLPHLLWKNLITSQLRGVLIQTSNIYSHTYDNKLLIKHGLRMYWGRCHLRYLSANNYINKYIK